MARHSVSTVPCLRFMAFVLMGGFYMRLLFEEYGDAILQALGGIGILICLIYMLRADGALHAFIVQLLDSAC